MRFTQDTRDAYAWSASQTRSSANLSSVVEYSLLTMMVIGLVSTGATLVGTKLTGVFSTVAIAIEQPGRLQNAVSYGQRTSRKGAPVEREVSSRFSALISSPLRSKSP